MKAEKSCCTPKTKTKPRGAKTQPVKAGIKMRSGLRAGCRGEWTTVY